MNDSTELIPVELAGEYIEVHPSTLAAHAARGWRQCAKREEKDPEGAKKAATVDELRKALTEKGVEIPEGAKKADLQALLDAANQPSQQ
ncbi:HeH/LEM domain-containing protein [Cupriavidus sp.]|uniref:HeH/LEM domain-containing protein n=1 Tax=Cupriavidus sp. TaxID=1873897 RepID=UPI003D0B5580